MKGKTEGVFVTRDVARALRNYEKFNGRINMPATIKLFGAEWCGTCKMIRPLLDRIGDVEYIDVDEDVDSTAEHGVRNLPTYINMDNLERGSGPVKNLLELKEVLGIE